MEIQKAVCETCGKVHVYEGISPRYHGNCVCGTPLKFLKVEPAKAKGVDKPDELDEFLVEGGDGF